MVTDPGIIKPMDFIHEVIDRRFPNPFMPDTPQRIASDTSQKISVRFGETIKAYAERPGLDPQSLTFIPLAIAGCCGICWAWTTGESPCRAAVTPCWKSSRASCPA